VNVTPHSLVVERSGLAATREITTMRRTSNVVKRAVLSDFGSQNEHLAEW